MIFELAIKILPVEKRGAYSEEWSEVNGEWPSARLQKTLHTLDLLRASISIRLQQNARNTFAAGLGCLATLSAIYLSSLMARDIVFAIVFLVLRKKIDFRQRMASLASFVSAIHFILIGAVGWLIFLSQWLPAHYGNFALLGSQPVKFFLACLAACSLLAGLAAITLWLLDSATRSTRTFALRAISLFFVFSFAVYWLFEMNSNLSVIGGVLMPIETAADLSRLQQHTTNLILLVAIGAAISIVAARVGLKFRSTTKQ